MPRRPLTLPPFRALLAFHAAASHDRLSAAAESLGVTESAVSHQIRGLEDRLHVKLFDRGSGRLTLTEAGARYLSRIEPALRAIEDATAALAPRDGATVRVTLPSSFAVTWLLPRLGAFEEANPGVNVEIVATTRLLDLARDQIDAAIRYGAGGWPEVEATFLFEDLATPVAAPGLIKDGEEPSAALSRVRLIANRSIPDEWGEWARARGLAPPSFDAALRLDAVEQALQAAEAGHGLAMGRSPYIETRLADGRLVAPFGAAGPTGAAYHLCRAAGRIPTTPARRFLTWIEKEARDFAASASIEQVRT